jgi:kumamolisin
MQCRAYFKLQAALPHDTTGVSYTPPQLRTIYSFPPDLDGSGETIAFIELGGGHSQPDFDSYFGGFSYNPLPKPFKMVGVRGATSSPSGPNSADGEVMLDGCVGIGTAPGAQGIFVYAPNDDNGIGDAINAAVAAGATIIVICWGAAEGSWSPAGMDHTTAALHKAEAAGVTVIVACGDNGSGDNLPGKNVDFPSSSAHVLGVGGTRMTQASAAGRTEVVWNSGTTGGATGGGVSLKFDIPDWQKKANVPSPGDKRAVPDIAAVADPGTGYLVIVTSQQMVIGGTSGAAPLWGGAIACVNQGLLRAGGKRLGFANPFIYSLIDGPPVFYDVVNGNNGTYIARPLYDCCTGYGTPYVDRLLAAAMLAQGIGGPPPPPPPPPSGAQITLSQPLPAGTFNLQRV